MNISNQNQNPAVPSPVVGSDEPNEKFRLDYETLRGKLLGILPKLSDGEFAALFRIASSERDRRVKVTNR